MACLGSHWELASLVGEDSVAYVVDFSVDVLNLSSTKLSGMHIFKRFGFGGSDIFTALVEMAFRSFGCFWIVLSYVVFGEEGPAFGDGGEGGADGLLGGGAWVVGDEGRVADLAVAVALPDEVAAFAGLVVGPFHGSGTG